jgi:branched-subunit amino acid transport protein
MNYWPILIASGLLTYGIRLSFILLFSQASTPPLLQRALRFVPPAVLSAIVAQELFYHGGIFNFGFGNLRLLAGLVAVLVAWRTKNTLVTILVGMAALFLLQWLVV